MEKIIKYTQPILIIILITSLFFLWDKTEIQTSRIDTLNKTLYDVAAHKKEIYIEIQKTQFKEDYYLNQLSNSTTLIMTMIAVITTLGGFLTYKSFNDKIQKSEADLKQTNTDIADLKSNLTNLNDKTFKDFEENINKVIENNNKQLNEISISLNKLKASYRNDIFNTRLMNMLEESNIELKTILSYLQNEHDTCLHDSTYVANHSNDISSRLEKIYEILKRRQSEDIDDNNIICDILFYQMEFMNSLDHILKPHFTMVFDILKQKIKYKWPIN